MPDMQTDKGMEDMTPNPKIQERREANCPAADYPRWTASMKKLLAGIKEFRDILHGTRWN